LSDALVVISIPYSQKEKPYIDHQPGRPKIVQVEVVKDEFGLQLGENGVRSMITSSLVFWEGPERLSSGISESKPPFTASLRKGTPSIRGMM
jgi:hypothetical protein